MSELWDYYHSDAKRLLFALFFFVSAFVLSEFGLHLPALLGLLVSSFLLVVTMLRIPKVIGITKGLSAYLAHIAAFVYCYANVYHEFGITQNDAVITSFKNITYFSIVTWTTLGYGDFQPTPESRIWAASEALVGYLFMGILVGLILAYLSPEKSQFSGKRPAKKYDE